MSATLHDLREVIGGRVRESFDTHEGVDFVPNAGPGTVLQEHKQQASVSGVEAEKPSASTGQPCAIFIRGIQRGNLRELGWIIGYDAVLHCLRYSPCHLLFPRRPLCY